MKEYATKIETDGEVLVDIDCTTNDSYIGITDKGNIITPFDKFIIHKSFEFPIIRQISDTQFLIAESRVVMQMDNCFIYNFEGKQLGHFFAGDGIQDIEIYRDKIIVTYFDEGVFGMTGPNIYGIVIFDLNGEILFRYNEKHAEQIILDCYCLCKHGANRILFLPYAEFRLIELNLDTKEETRFDIPEEVKGSNAITSTADSFIFHSPYEDKRGLFKWRTGDERVEKIGEYTEGLRGLKNGRFLSKGESGFTIIDLC